MKNLFFTFLSGVLLASHAFAQKTLPALNSDLALKWQVLENYYNNRPQAHAALTITTTHGLPAKGWKLYFNADEPIVPGSPTGNINVNHVNGDLYYFSPAPGFAGIKENDSLRVELVAQNWLINISDTPQGFYIVWDKEPQNGYALKAPVLIPSTQPKQFLRTPGDLVPVTTPALLYEQNKVVKDIPADSLVKIFPTPDSYQISNAKFKLEANVRISADPLFRSEASLLKAELAKVLIAGNNAKVGNIIKLVNKPMPTEAYELRVTNNSILVAASSPAGAFYGIQSLKTLLPAQAWQHPQKSILIPGVIVTDKPRFGYRALMLDVARNFQAKKDILKLLDLMALFKLNVFHFHLTDDEAWRLEIKGLPELTNVGSKRGHVIDEDKNLQPSLGSGPFLTNPSGTGYYSSADFVEILQYAVKRHIVIIPEIESPGHARAAIKAMDARYKFYMAQNQKKLAQQYLLRDLRDSSVYLSVQNYNDNVIDVSLPSTYQFVEAVTAEIERLYKIAGTPFKSIHFGGDEVPLGAWEKSPAFLKLKQIDTAIKTTDDLWAYYYTRVNQIAQAHHVYLTAWEEVGSKKVIENGKKISVINPSLTENNIHLEVWNNVIGWGSEDLAYKLANQGYKVILSPVTNTYFDMAANKAYDEPGYYWGGYADVDRPFSFIPYDYFKNIAKGRLGENLAPTAFAGKERLTDIGVKNIIGLQGALWAETIRSPKQMEYMLLPKLLGLAERAWASNPDWATATDSTEARTLYSDAWSRFVNVLGKQELPRLSYYAGGFNYRIPSPGAIVINGQVIVNMQLPGFQVRYTNDGTSPTKNSNLYTNPIQSKGKIKIGLFATDGRSGKVITVDNN